MINKKPQVLQKKQQLAHCELRLDSVKKAYETAKKAVDSHEQQIKNTETQMKQIEKEKSKLEEKLAQESEQRGISLNEQDVAEYRRLKAEVEKRCTVVSTNLDNKRREQEAAISNNQFDERRLVYSREKLDQRDKAIETARKAVALAPGNEGFKKNLTRFESGPK